MIIWPEKVNLTFNTVPAGLTLYLDGIAKVDAVRLRHADRLQPHDRGARPELGRNDLHVRVLVGRRRAKPSDRRPGRKRELSRDVPGGGWPGAGCRLRLRRGLGNDLRGPVGLREQRDAVEHDVDNVRQVRRCGGFQRNELARNCQRLGLPRLDLGDDVGGVGLSDCVGWLARRHLQGTGRHLLPGGLFGYRAARDGRHLQPESAGRGVSVAAERLVSSRGHLRRLDDAHLRQRSPGGDQGSDRTDRNVDRRLDDRKRRPVRAVPQRQNRRGPHLQRRADRRSDRERHEHSDQQPGSRHAAADGADEFGGVGGELVADQFELDSIDRRCGGDGIPGGALSGRGLLELRRGRAAVGDVVQRRESRGEHEL